MKAIAIIGALAWFSVFGGDKAYASFGAGGLFALAMRQRSLEVRK